MRTLSPEARRGLALLYIAAGVVIFEQLIEIAALTYPPFTSIPSWRFGFLGISVARTGSLVVADAMLLTAAIALDQRRLLKVVGVLHLLLAIVLVPLMAMLTLDALTMRRAIRRELVHGFDLAAARTLLTCGIIAVASTIVFWVVYRMKPTKEEPKASGRGILLTDLPTHSS